VRLEAKIAVVTAAGAGIGRATALAFHKEGARVWASDIDERALNELKAEAPSIEVGMLDVRDEAAIGKYFTEIGRCDVLFNCAGMVPNGTILDSSISVFNATWELNVLSMVRTVRAVLPGMLERGSGSIVNMASIVSSVKGAPNRCAYGTTKAAVIGLTKSIAADFVTRGIRCNAICPGTTDTPSLRGRLAGQPDPAAARAAFIARQPMARFASADEIAAMAVYLASDESAFVTGQAFAIDGGWTI
jgi:2-dehydro-3-deoxy-L-fuconate 4-dehydrogenase